MIKGGIVVDGRRTPRFRADIGILDGKVAKIGNLRDASANKVIDAEGCIVAPGIIDLHTHYDSQVFWDPYVSPSGWHGVTSVIMGNCGFGFAPVTPEHREAAMLTMTRAEEVPMVCMKEGIPWDWVTYPEFVASLERTPKAVNVLPLMPLNPLMAWVMGMDRAKAGALPSDAEHAEMARLLNEAMDAGAGGFSAQRHGPNSPQRDYDGSPMITDVMHDETMLYLAKVLGDRDEGIIQYNYNDPAATFGRNMERINEIRVHVQDVARVSGRPVLVAVLGEGDRRFIEESHAVGLRIYPGYLTGGLGRKAEGSARATSVAEQAGALDKAGGGWALATAGTVDEVKAKFADPSVRDAMRADLAQLTTTLGEMGSWLLVRAATPELAKYEQTTLGQIAADMGYDDLVDAFCEINLREDLKTKFQMKALFTAGADEGPPAHPDLEFLFARGLETFKKIADDPWGVPGGSDGGAHTKSMTSGNFGIHFLSQYVREHGLLSLEEGHWRVSGLPSFQGGLGPRGTLVEGAPADIIVYDFDALDITERVEAHDYPGGEWRLVDRPVGLHYVLVNGHVTMDHDRQTDIAAGQVVRKSRVLEPA